jgi:hypothetical protein
MAIFGRPGMLAVADGRLSPSGARELIVTDPTTPSEARSFDAMKPTLAQCLPEGETASLAKLAVRGTIAMNYYRLAHHGHEQCDQWHSRQERGPN